MLHIHDEGKLQRSNLVSFFTDDGVFAGSFEVTLPSPEDTDKKISIWNLSILEELRGRGLGKQMAVEMVEMLREKYSQYSKAYLRVIATNVPAKRIYSLAGFEIVPNPPGWSGWAQTMEINLH